MLAKWASKSLVLPTWWLVSFSLSAHGASFSIYSSSDDKRALLRSHLDVAFFYDKVGWNRDSEKIESGVLFLLDRKTGIFKKLEFTETGKDSSIFSIRLSKEELGESDREIEIYSSPKTNMGDNFQEQMTLLVNAQRLRRKPFVLRSQRRLGQTIDIFDKRVDAQNTFQKYRDLIAEKIPKDTLTGSIIEINESLNLETRSLIDPATLINLEELTRSAQKRELEKARVFRKNFFLAEKERRNQSKLEAKGWSTDETAKNEKLGASVFTEALTKTEQEDWTEARDLMLKASNLVPHSENLYQQYGLSLFRNKEYNKALIALDLVQTPAEKQVTKVFYKGLSFFHIHDYPPAIGEFNKVLRKFKNQKSNQWAVAAAFYKGVCLHELEKYDAAKISFQYVLDHSKNSKLDQKAEDYIDYGIQKKALLQQKKKQWFFSGLLGSIYDSNVILLLDSVRNQPNQNINTEGLRFMGRSNVKYRPFFEENNELAVELEATLIQTTDLGFSVDETLTQADPWIFAAALPFNHRGQLSKKNYSFQLTPRFESLVMDLRGTGKEVILNSILLNFDNTLVANKNLILKGDLRIRNDSSTQEGGLSEASAMLYGVGFSAVVVFNKSARRYLIPNFGYSINDAVGANFSYNRLDVGLTFTTSLFSKLIWTNRIAYFLANYRSASSIARVDNNYSATSGLSYPINTHWDLGLNVNIQKNDSTTNPFDKFQAMLTAGFRY